MYNPRNGAVVCYSGGCDSLTMLAHLVKGRVPPKNLHVLNFDYGQRHKKEMDFAERICDDWGIQRYVYKLNLADFGRSPLVDSDIDVPSQKDAKQELTVVPFRNTMFLVTAAAHATIHNIDDIYLGPVREDWPAYPDCRPEYFAAMQHALRLADQHAGLRIVTPFIDWYKHEIVQLGVEAYNLDYSNAWTCYKGKEKHCGVCDACVERKESFQKANLPDPTEYEV